MDAETLKITKYKAEKKAVVVKQRVEAATKRAKEIEVAMKSTMEKNFRIKAA